MPIDVLMPQLSPTMTEGRLASWLKKEGDKVSAGDVIAEVETDKATMEVEAADDGVIHKIIGEVGADIKVGVPIAVLAEEGEEVPADYEPESSVVEEVAEENVDAAESVKTVSEDVAASAPVVAAPVPVANVSPAPTPVVTAVASDDDGRVKASPLAKRLAATKGIDIATVAGSGEHGRIVKADVERAIKGGGAVVAAGKAAIVRKGDSVERNTPMRKAIANRLTAAKQSVPHFYLQASVEMDNLLAIREQINAAAKVGENGKPAYKISVNDMVIKACALALRDNPNANASWADDNIVKYGNVDVSVAVATEGGLITPIVFNAEQKSLMDVSAEVKALAGLARKGELKPEQYQGGTFSVSNLGMYGVKSFSAIINPPQGAILAVGASEKRAMVGAGDEIYVASVMDMTLSVDHRVIDGAVGAELLASIKFYLESPALLLI